MVSYNTDLLLSQHKKICTWSLAPLRGSNMVTRSPMWFKHGQRENTCFNCVSNIDGDFHGEILFYLLKVHVDRQT